MAVFYDLSLHNLKTHVSVPVILIVVQLYYIYGPLGGLRLQIALYVL